MGSSKISHAPVFIHVDETRQEQLPGKAISHLVIDIGNKTYSLHGQNGAETHALPQKFTHEVSKLGGSITADLAWTLFRRIVLGQTIEIHPAAHLNIDLSEALVRNAATPLSSDEQQKLEQLLLNRYQLLELLIQSKRQLEALDQKIERKAEEKMALAHEIKKIYKTIEFQKKAIAKLPPHNRKEPICDLETMELHAAHMERQMISIDKSLQRMLTEKTTVEEEGIHRIPGVADRLDPELIMKSQQLSLCNAPFLTVLEKEIEAMTYNALTLIEKEKL